MNYKELADLLFPDAKPVTYYEEKYPARDLKEGAAVVRLSLIHISEPTRP